MFFFTANKNFFGIGHFPFNQNVRLEFSTTSISEWNNIFQKEDNRARPQFSKQFSRKFSFHSTLLLEFLEFSVKCFALRKFNSSRESSREISVPFALASIFFERFGWMESVHNLLEKRQEVCTKRRDVFHLQDWWISSRNGVYRLDQSFPFSKNGRENPENGIKDGLEEMEHEIRLKHSVHKNGTTFSDIPLLLAIFRWNDAKGHVPFTFQPDFPETNCKW